jgi:hypothetical protein
MEGTGNQDGLCPSGLGLAQAAPESSAAEVQVRTKPGARPGDSLVLFTAQDFRLAEDPPDSTLLHELFHSLRIALRLDQGAANLPPPTAVMGTGKAPLSARSAATQKRATPRSTTTSKSSWP